MYIAVIRPFLIYRAIAWHHPQPTPLTKPTSVKITDKLAKQQNRCIYLIANIYKATPILIVKAKIFILLLNLHLDLVIARAIKRMMTNRIVY